MSVPARGRRRQEGGEKVTGATRFTADLELSGLLHVHLVVSQAPSARIRGIETSAARSAPGDIEVRQSYRFAAAHHSFLEPHVAVARPEPDGGLTIWSPTQGPFVVRDEVATLLDLPTHKVRVVPMPVGGGFGGKVELLEPLLALIAVRVRRPVRLSLTRSHRSEAHTSD